MPKAVSPRRISYHQEGEMDKELELFFCKEITNNCIGHVNLGRSYIGEKLSCHPHLTLKLYYKLCPKSFD